MTRCRPRHKTQLGAGGQLKPRQAPATDEIAGDVGQDLGCAAAPPTPFSNGYHCGAEPSPLSAYRPSCKQAAGAQSLIMNGEAVCVDARGRADFDRLHSKCFDHEAVLVAFDLMELNGLDWAKQPLEKRKARLAKLLKTPSDITYNEHFEDDGEKISL